MYYYRVPEYEYRYQRKKIADAKIALLRDGMLMKYNNNYDPATVTLSDDPFSSPTQPLKMRKGEYSIVLYSVGPDGIDDGGVKEYEPYNDEDKTGDIMIDFRINN